MKNGKYYNYGQIQVELYTEQMKFDKATAEQHELSYIERESSGGRI